MCHYQGCSLKLNAMGGHRTLTKRNPGTSSVGLVEPRVQVGMDEPATGANTSSWLFPVDQSKDARNYYFFSGIAVKRRHLVTLFLATIDTRQCL